MGAALHPVRLPVVPPAIRRHPPVHPALPAVVFRWFSAMISIRLIPVAGS